MKALESLNKLEKKLRIIPDKIMNMIVYEKDNKVKGEKKQ